jgi:hypothetical protein
MNTTSEVPRPGAPPGASALAVKLGVLGMISGALSWALINFADELHLKFEYEGYGLELLPVGVYPGLVFGLLFGGLLRFSAKVSWPRAIGYVFAAGLGYLAAFHVAFYLIATVNEQGPVTITVSGIPAGLAGSLVLGVLAKALLQVPARLVLRRPVIVGTLAGALLGLGSIDDHNGLGFLAFFVLWQGAYGASLAPMLQASAQRSA